MRTLVACLLQLVAYAIKAPGYVYKLYSAFLVWSWWQWWLWWQLWLHGWYLITFVVMSLCCKLHPTFRVFTRLILSGSGWSTRWHRCLWMDGYLDILFVTFLHGFLQNWSLIRNHPFWVKLFLKWFFFEKYFSPRPAILRLFCCPHLPPIFLQDLTLHPSSLK